MENQVEETPHCEQCDLLKRILAAEETRVVEYARENRDMQAQLDRALEVGERIAKTANAAQKEVDRLVQINAELRQKLGEPVFPLSRD
jgi:hypothetical protein